MRCGLCPRRCTIAEGKSGYCGVRHNEGGILRSLAYGHPVALQIDPIEKKPLCQFLPGSRTYSIGTFGCNLGCLFCQNSELSRGEYDPGDLGEEVKPEWLAADAVRNGCESIAFTYNEPTVFAEYALEIARCAHRAGLKTVLVSNGFITPEAAETLYPEIDAANFDMKGFSETFYKELCGGSLEPVLEAFRILPPPRRTRGIHDPDPAGEKRLPGNDRRMARLGGNPSGPGSSASFHGLSSGLPLSRKSADASGSAADDPRTRDPKRISEYLFGKYSLRILKRIL